MNLCLRPVQKSCHEVHQAARDESSLQPDNVVFEVDVILLETMEALGPLVVQRFIKRAVAHPNEFDSLLLEPFDDGRDIPAVIPQRHPVFAGPRISFDVMSADLKQHDVGLERSGPIQGVEIIPRP